MIITLFILSIYTILVCSPIPIYSNFSTIECYESFSNPKIVIRLHHYNPSGPRYLFIEFQSQTYPLDETMRMIYFYRGFHFKKVEGQCKNNVIFSTSGVDLKELWVGVRIHLSSSENEMTFMSYYFHRYFKEDDYLLVDHDGNFAIEANIAYSKDQFLTTVQSDLYENEVHRYLNLISNTKGKLCIITQNNREFVVHPKYVNETPNGFITRIKFKFDYVVYGHRAYDYSAFECDTKRKYINDIKVFIGESFPRSMLHLSVVYIKYKNGIIVENSVPFIIPGLILNDLPTSLYFPKTFKILYLMKLKVEYVFCPKSYVTDLQIGEFGSSYNAIDEVEIEVMPKVKKVSWINVDPLRLCR